MGGYRLFGVYEPQPKLVNYKFLAASADYARLPLPLTENGFEPFSVNPNSNLHPIHSGGAALYKIAKQFYSS
jgi:hypothetical protein